MASEKSKYILRVSDDVRVPVKTTIDGKVYKFVLLCKRLPADELRAALKDEESMAHEFLAKVAHGWEGQEIVIDPDTNQAAEFCADALAALCNVPGMSMAAFNAYLANVGAKEKN